MRGEKPRRKRAGYWESPEVKAWIMLEAENARDLELFDRAMRWRSARFRARNQNPDAADSPPVRARTVAGGRPFSLRGYLEYSNEDAAEALGLRAGRKPGEWEGPRRRFDLLLGEQRTWTAEQMETSGPCPICRDAELGGVLDTEVIATIVCLWCGRSNIDDRLGPTAAKAPDQKPKGTRSARSLKGGRK